MNGGSANSRRTPKLRVVLEDGREFSFLRTFTIGRGEDCDVRIDDAEVSRHHASAVAEAGQWFLRDHSRNGIFAGGQPLRNYPIRAAVQVTLGPAGPTVEFEPMSGTAAGRAAEPAPPPPAASDSSLEDYAKRYFDPAADEESVGDRTIMIRKAFDQVRRKHQRRNNAIIAATSIIALSAAGVAYYNYRELQALRALTQNEFYDLKVKDVQIALLEERVAEGDAGARVEREKLRRIRLEQARENEQKMNRLVYGKNLNETDRLILRVTRRLGECELSVPDGYLDKVKGYIAEWRSTGRFANALSRAQKFGYVPRITEALLEHNLPPDFFYLAMQESNFDPAAVGPKTRYGFAKGMWQFIPETGKTYGLRIGPLVDQPLIDAEDERQDWSKATGAAARYIKQIYTTDAQASGLLVMASYNWGEHRVIDRVKEMPAHPSERNFWKLISNYRIPDETYNYVFRIVAAAVIGENPRAFAFDFDNPLRAALDEYTARQ